MFSGETGIPGIMADPATIGLPMLLLMALLKPLLLALSLKSGFLGGPIFPALFTSTMVGLAISLVVPGLPLAILGDVSGGGSDHRSCCRAADRHFARFGAGRSRGNTGDAGADYRGRGGVAGRRHGRAAGDGPACSASAAHARAYRGISASHPYSISPGYTLTPMNKRPEVAEQLKAFATDTPMARIAGVDDMVGPAIFLASGQPRSVRGLT